MTHHDADFRYALCRVCRLSVLVRYDGKLAQHNVLSELEHGRVVKCKGSLQPALTVVKEEQ